MGRVKTARGIIVTPKCLEIYLKTGRDGSEQEQERDGQRAYDVHTGPTTVLVTKWTDDCI